MPDPRLVARWTKEDMRADWPVRFTDALALYGSEPAKFFRAIAIEFTTQMEACGPLLFKNVLATLGDKREGKAASKFLKLLSDEIVKQIISCGPGVVQKTLAEMKKQETSNGKTNGRKKK